jgi:putative membrane protein
MGAGWLVMTLSWMVLLAVIAALVVWIFPSQAHRGSGPEPSPTAREVLDQRLARGEIDVETYRALRHELAHTGPLGGDVRR